MKKYLAFLLCLFVGQLFAQNVTISTTEDILCPGQSADLTVNANLGNRVADFPMIAGQEMIINYAQNFTIGTFTYEFWFQTTDNIVLLPEHVDGLYIYDATMGQNFAVYPQQIWSPTHRRSSGVSVGANGISIIEHSHQFVASRFSLAVPLVGWHHVAVVYTNSNFEVFLDGVSVGTRLNGSNYPPHPTSGLVPVTVACKPNLGNGYPAASGIDDDPNDRYYGQLDEFRVWNTALTASDVANIYNRKLVVNNMANNVLHMSFDMSTHINTTTNNPTVTVTGINPANGASVAYNPNTAGVTYPQVNIPQIETFAGSSLATAITGPFLTAYLWNNSSTNQTITVNPTAATTTYTVTASTGTATATGSITISVSTPTAIISKTSPSTICSNEFALLSANSGSSYLWSNGDTTQQSQVNSAGAYSVMVTNADGCTATSTNFDLAVNPAPLASISALSATTFCDGGSVILTTDSTSVNNWSNGESFYNATITTSGWYSVTNTNELNCSVVSDSIQVVVNPNPIATITPSGPTNFCQGLSVDLLANGGTISWSNGSVDSLITINNTDTLTLTVSSEFGCVGQISEIITVYELPIVTAPNDTLVCLSNNTFSGEAFPTGGTWSGNNVTNDTLTFVNPGVYLISYLFTNSNACSNSDTMLVQVDAPLPVSAGTDINQCQPTNPIDLSLNSASPADGTWSGPFLTGTIANPIDVGLYTYTYSFNDVCSSTDSIHFHVYAVPAAPTISGNLYICKGVPSPLWSNYVGGNVWSTSSTNDTIYIADSGIYGLTYIDSNGCSSSNQVTVQEYPETTPLDISGPTAVLNGSQQSYSINPQPGYTYTWNVNGGTILSGQGTSSIEVLWDSTASSFASVQIIWSNTYGCEHSDAQAVSIQPDAVEEGLSFSEQIQLFPNPTQGIFRLKGLNPNKTYDLTILDLRGKANSHLSVNQRAEIEVNAFELQSGLYFIRIFDEENAITLPLQIIH
ncbi:MAG: T9SS type A sorting domain-containing protein [Bacteroidetes bacterium]|nr:T9SS type A sorting domain-containing protein [Bacteroidota bacterium]